MKLDFLTSLRVHAGRFHRLVIRRVSPLLHTPLMSLTNALDAIAVVGAIILAGEHKTNFSTVLGTIAIVAATRRWCYSATPSRLSVRSSAKFPAEQGTSRRVRLAPI
jgi:NAD(P) transhydrogenase subunit alpha